MSRRAWRPTDEQRNVVRTMSAGGIQQDRIAEIFNIDEKTLRKHCRAELDYATDQTTAVAVAELFKQVKSGNMAAICFWLKCRAGWREVQVHAYDPSSPPERVIVEYTDKAIPE